MLVEFSEGISEVSSISIPAAPDLGLAPKGTWAGGNREGKETPKRQHESITENVQFKVDRSKNMHA